ncbi:MAG: hypothetical protein JJ921_09755 [Pseudomonadales bacterium]|nr:hypothetical protein [Pseudomonadales bacterium]MBO7004768.1 hypothetical protein [Pseudomonadales bacterium]
MKVLGINAYHGDSAAALLLDGEVVSAAEEERFRRIKHWAGFPGESIQWCLASQGLTLSDLDAIAINQDSGAHFVRKSLYGLTRLRSPKLLFEKLKTRRARHSIESEFVQVFPDQQFSGQLHHVEHHQAHLASSFWMSGLKEAWSVSIDGFGDFSSSSWGVGQGMKLAPSGRVFFPHSLGAFYQAMTQFLGFPNYGDEYKVMGLAPYGEPRFLKEMEQLVILQDDGSFKLDLSYFVHHQKNVMFEWSGGYPEVGKMFSDHLEGLLGPARNTVDELTQRHMDMARSVQAMYEKALFHLLNALHRVYPIDALTLSGGCGMNSVANGKIRLNTPFEKIYIQPAAGDAGGAVGAALVAAANLGSGQFRPMRHAYLGPSFSTDEIGMVIEQEDMSGFNVTQIEDSSELCEKVASLIANAKVVGWFQGAMEWGPRALGHRSIVCDPRRSDMKEILNIKIKRRESFRPFAPSVLREHAFEWFEQDDDVPFMMKVFQIREEKREEVPAVTHVDGSGRLQTVTSENNGRYYDLIKAFFKQTGVPMILNTSFNENEPIVCTPLEALSCFQRTKMDALVLGDWLIERHG